MPREPRIYMEKVLYLVTAKVNNDRALFRDVQDYANYLEPLSEYKREYGFKLFAFALMPKQLCLLIELKNDVTISRIMHDLNSKYTKVYNSRYGTKGHLFKSRFKSIMIEKEDHLIRLTRYIHTLPKITKSNTENKNYPYSSYRIFLNAPKNRVESLEMPAMYDEVHEVLEHLSGSSVEQDLARAYESYVGSIDNDEIDTIRKMLHRTAFVGSKEFIDEIKNKVEEHVQDEIRPKVVRRTNRVFAFAGSLVVMFLCFVAYNFYGGQSELQSALNATTTSFEIAREDLAQRVTNLQVEITGLMEQKFDGLNDLSWDIELSHVKGINYVKPMIDRLSFRNGQLVSLRLEQEGYQASEYSTTVKDNGEVVWQTVHVNPDGAKVSWYGIWQNKKLRGILSERPAEGKGRDFSFVNISDAEKGGR